MVWRAPGADSPRDAPKLSVDASAPAVPSPSNCVDKRRAPLANVSDERRVPGPLPLSPAVANNATTKARHDPPNRLPMPSYKRGGASVVRVGRLQRPREGWRVTPRSSRPGTKSATENGCACMAEGIRLACPRGARCVSVSSFRIMVVPHSAPPSAVHVRLAPLSRRSCPRGPSALSFRKFGRIPADVCSMLTNSEVAQMLSILAKFDQCWQTCCRRLQDIGGRFSTLSLSRPTTGQICVEFGQLWPDD